MTHPTRFHRRRLVWLSTALALALVVILAVQQLWPQTQIVGANVITLPAATGGFARAMPGDPIILPEDHGAHPAFQTEWWYFTGNLGTSANPDERWGYQFTIFRRALAPASAERDSKWGSSQVYLAHFAITDAGRSTHSAAERFSRDGPGLAGAQAAPFRVWLEDWEVIEVEPDRWRLRASHDDYSLDLALEPDKTHVLHGKDGYSQKGSDPGNASHYYSYPRLQTSGSITRGDQTIAVEGLSWMDHEWSTSVLEPGQVGWDWFSMQLDNGWDLMAFQLRRSDGTVDPFTGGTLVSPAGEVIHLASGDFTIRSEGEWQSPAGDAVYPDRWRIEVPAQKLLLELRPLLADQEMRLSTRYWEGAVVISGEHEGQSVSGRGYVEMTGYAESMEGRL